MRPMLNRMLTLQMIHCFTGIMYNVDSPFAQRHGQSAWASTDVVMGLVGVALSGLLLSAGLMESLVLYPALMGASVALLGHGGVITVSMTTRVSGPPT